MDSTIAKIKLCNPRDISRCVELELLVDTGSTYTWIRSDKLKALGIEPTTIRRFEQLRTESLSNQSARL